MSKPDPNPQTLALDYQSRQFFDPADWEGPVEAHFHLGVRGLEGREFRGRMARFCDGGALMVLQEAGGEATFVRGVPLASNAVWDREEVGRLWTALLSLGEFGRRDGIERSDTDSLPLLPELSACGGLARLHYDARSGFGFLMGCGGDCVLFDLREEERARRHVFALLLGDLVCPRGIRALVETTGAAFHARVEEQLRDAGSKLHQTLRFWRLSVDGRSREVFGCNFATLGRAVELLRLALVVEMGPGGDLCGHERATWHPFAGDGGGEVLWVAGCPDEVETPARLLGWREAICMGLGCRPRAGDRGHGHAVALDWAGHFGVRAERPSAHEAMEAARQLQEMLN